MISTNTEKINTCPVLWYVLFLESVILEIAQVCYSTNRPLLRLYIAAFLSFLIFSSSIEWNANAFMLKYKCFKRVLAFENLWLQTLCGASARYLRTVYYAVISIWIYSLIFHILFNKKKYWNLWRVCRVEILCGASVRLFIESPLKTANENIVVAIAF